MADLAEIMEAIAAIRRLPELGRVEIHVDGLPTISAALDRAGILMKPDPKTAGAPPMFAGVPIITNGLMPPGFAMVKRDGVVVSILDFREAARTEREKQG